MRKTIKKASARLICLMLAVLMTLSACGTVGKLPEKLNSTGEITDYSGIFQPQAVKWPASIPNLQAVTMGGSSVYAVVARSYGYSLERFSLAENKLFNLATAEDEIVSDTVLVTRTISRVTAVPDGAWYLRVTTTQDTSDPLKTEVTTVSEMIHIDNAGSELARMDITEGLGDSMVRYISADDNGNAVAIGEGKLWVFDSDGGLLFTADTADIARPVRSGAGDVYLCQISSSGDTYTYTLSPVDMEAKKLGKALDLTDYFAYYMCSGVGSADFYFVGINGICSLTLETGEVAQVLDYSFHGISGDDVVAVSADELGNFYYLDYTGATEAIPYGLVYMQSVENIISAGGPGNGDSTTLPPILGEKKILTLGVPYIFPATRNAITEFNKYSTEYNIKIIDYFAMAGSDVLKARELIKLDIVNGVGPDIFDISQLDIPRENWGMVALDLYAFFDSDAEFGRDTIIPSILSAIEFDGALRWITPTFEIDTLVGKQSFLGTELGWSLEDMRALEATLPEGTALVGDMTNIVLLRSLFDASVNTFISKDGDGCDFTSDKFISLLEWCNDQPQSPKYSPSESSKYDDVAAVVQQLDLALQDDLVVLAQAGIMSLRDIRAMKDALGAEVNFIGYPGDGYGASFRSSDGFSISPACQYPEGAWAFIKTTLTAEFRERDNVEIYGMPTNAALFEDVLQTDMLPFSQRGENYRIPAGCRVAGNWSIFSPRSVAAEQERLPFTEAEAQQLRDIISVTASWWFNDSVIWTIIEDSVEPYFSGQKSAREVAEVIQNRVSTLLAERN